MRIKELVESDSGTTTSSQIGTFIKGGAGPNVGTLFGGTYGQKTGPKKKAKPKKESLIRR